MFDETTWKAHLDRLGLPLKLHRGFYDVAVAGAYEAVEDIMRERAARLKLLGSEG